MLFQFGASCWLAVTKHLEMVYICPFIKLAWTYDPQHGKTNEITCAPSEDLDEPGHPPSLIRVFAVRMKKSWVLSYPMSAQRRLWSDWMDAWSESSRGAQVILLVLSYGGSYSNTTRMATSSASSILSRAQQLISWPSQFYSDHVWWDNSCSRSSLPWVR